MKLTLTLVFYLVYLSSVCAVETNSCENITEPSGIISYKYANQGQYHLKCWLIKIPEGSYARLNLTSIKLNGWACSSVHVRFSVVGGSGNYTFCSQDKPRQPVIVLNDVEVFFVKSFDTGRDSHEFSLNYTTESLLCAKNGHFRCSKHQCVDQQQVCDGTKDCTNGNDEASCESLICAQKDHFRCSERHCILLHQVCDGVKDCANGTDEASCELDVTAIEGVNASRENAVTWLKSQRTDSYGWRENTHRAITALYLSAGRSFQKGALEDNLLMKQLELQTAVAWIRNFNDPISVNELSMFINALSITCRKPQNFYGQDLLEILSKRVRTLGSTSPGAFLTLCNANWTISDSQIRSLLSVLSTHSGHFFHLDIQAMSLMALTCIKNKMSTFYGIENATEIYNDTVKNFISHQQRDGSFGNVYTTAVVTQALLSTERENRRKWNLASTIQYLIRKLNSSSVDFLSVYFVAPIFNDKSLVDMEDIRCEKPRKEGKDDEISDILDKLGAKIQVKYFLYIGDKKDVVLSVYLKMPKNSSAYDVMRVAQVVDHKYTFLHTVVYGNVYIYEIAGMTNDPETGKFWLTYFRNSSANGSLQQYTQSPDNLFLNDGDHLVLWYKTAHI